MTALSAAEAKEAAREVPAWALSEKAIEREFRFKDFREAMAFVDRVADIAEEEGHHPDIWISWNRVKLTLTTHKIGGLSEKDFLVAARVDRAVQGENLWTPMSADERRSGKAACGGTATTGLPRGGSGRPAQ